MQFYLYSPIDLMIDSDGLKYIKAGDVCRIELNKEENVLVYPCCGSGVMVINQQLLLQGMHNNIYFHSISKDVMLCEIKPFVFGDLPIRFNIDYAEVQLINLGNETVVYYNSQYYGIIKAGCDNLTFEKIGKHKQCGLIRFGERHENVLLFNSNKVIYCGQCVDVETRADNIIMYAHKPNIFNVGQLINCNLGNGDCDIKIVKDRGVDFVQQSSKFDIIYFMEAVKIGRYKYAYNKLSYELKSNINIDVLREYFGVFDQYVYIEELYVYITFNNNKVSNIHRFEIKDGLVDNIY